MYPRQLAKTEDFGISLMDIGTGSILATSGIAAALIEAKDQSCTVLSRLAQTLKHTFLVFVVGIARPILLKAVNYQEHVGEYGTHWNFFITIGVITLLSTLIPPKYHPLSVVFALGLMLGYETALHTTGLKSYVLAPMEGQRTTFLDQNKEGVFQVFGYLACYLSGQSLGELLKWLSLHAQCGDLRRGMYQALYCLGTLAVFLGAYYFLEPTSRRLVCPA